MTSRPDLSPLCQSPRLPHRPPRRPQLRRPLLRGPLQRAASAGLRYMLGIAMLAAGPALQAEESPLRLSAAMIESIQKVVEASVSSKGRIEIKVGELDPRLQLAPCQRAEPVLAPGTRFWGRSHITIRCVAGAQWSILVPVTVSVFGDALVARANLPLGATPQPADFELMSIDLTRENASWVSDPEQLKGRSLARAVTAGQPLRTDQLKVTPTVQQGDQVKVRVPGSGFLITTDAVAMAAAGPGQSVRLRTESGKVISGRVQDGYVEVSP